MQLDFQRTCFACPEQYDVYVEGTNSMVGYVRLRGGNFTVECPDVGGDRVLYLNISDDGMFNSEESRAYFLNIAKEAIHKWVKENGVPKSIDFDDFF